MSHRLTSLAVLPMTLALLTGGLGIRGLYGEEKPATQPSVTSEVDKSANEDAVKPPVPWMKFSSATNLYLRIVPLEWSMLEKFAGERDIPWMENVYNQLKKQKPPRLLQWRIDPTLLSGGIVLPDWLDESPYYIPTDGEHSNDEVKTNGMVLLLDGNFQLPKEWIEALTSISGTGEIKYLDPILLSLANDEWHFKMAFLSEFLSVDLDFQGGDFAQFVVALQDRVNVAYEQQMPDILKAIMPPKITLSAEVGGKSGRLPRRVAEIRIQKKNLASQLGVLWWIAVNAEFKFKIIHDDPSRWKLSQTGAGSLHTMTENHMIYRNFGAESPEPVAYFNLRSAFRPNAANQLTAENVAALLDIRWKMNGPFVWGKTYYHPETDMMIVSGTDSEIELAKEVFKALTVKTDSVPSKPKSANPAQPETEE